MDPQKWLSFLIELLDRAHISPEIQLVIFRTILVCVIVYGVLWFFEKLYSRLKPFFSRIRFPSRKEKLERIRNRQRLAEVLEYEIRHIGELEEWNDREFVELEAEVEAEGRWTSPTWMPFWRQKRYDLRRESSLTQALGTSTERLILLQGEAGSGKSVALRHIAHLWSSAACSSQNVNSILPVYVNLKELTLAENQNIDHLLIREFILKSLNRLNDPEIQDFLDSEFDRGLQSGTWLFLFDSFDEIPEVLSATNVDQNIQAYSSAISDFLHDRNYCRAIVASRSFRGPQYTNWPRFNIVGLSGERRLKLIEAAGLDADSEELLLEGMSNASEIMKPMFSNPLFLALLCEYVRTERSFPENAHMVFETYITTRLRHDQQRIASAYHLELGEVREIAEEVAFAISIDEQIGLSPKRSQLKNVLKREKFTIHRYFDRALDTLELLRLAHQVPDSNSTEKSFTFTHRRIQEYFATCLVLRCPERVGARQLLLSGRWRETTVTLLQTQPIETIQPILHEAEKLTTELLSPFDNLIENPLAYVELTTVNSTARELYAVSLPEKMYHVFELLQDGLGNQRFPLPKALVERASQAILTVNECGPLYEKAWALSVSGVIYEPVLLYLLRSAFASRSMMVLDMAFQKVSLLRRVPQDIAQSIKSMLYFSALQDYYRLSAYVKRLPANDVYSEILKIQTTHPYNKKPGDFILEAILNIGLGLAAGICLGLCVFLFTSVTPIPQGSIVITSTLPQYVVAWIKLCFWIFVLLGFVSFSSFYIYWRLLYNYDHILSPAERPFSIIFYIYDYLDNGGIKDSMNHIEKEIEEAKAFNKLVFKHDAFKLIFIGFPLLTVLMCLLSVLFPDLTRASKALDARLGQIPYFSTIMTVLLTLAVIYVLRPFLPSFFTYLVPGILKEVSSFFFATRDRYFLKWTKYAKQKVVLINSFDELRNMLVDFGDSLAITVFLRLIRVNQLISLNPEMAKQLADFSMKIEMIAPKVANHLKLKEQQFYIKKGDRATYKSILEQMNDYREFLFSHEPETGLRNIILYNSTIRISDELNSILNQIRTAQRN